MTFVLVCRRWVVPLLVGAVAALFRLASATDLSNDHYMSLMLSQQLLHGALPGRDFVDPGMPLAILLSAFPQMVLPGTFAEVALCAAMFGIAAGVTCVAVELISGSLLVAVAAAAIEVVLQPRLYSYPKILVPAVAAWLLARYAQTPSRGRLALVAVWAVIATLLRHDLGVYVAVAGVVVIVVRGWGEWARLLRDLAWFLLVGVLTAAPYLGYVEWAEGIGEHWRRVVEFARSEVYEPIETLPGFPWFTRGGAWSSDDAAALLYYAVHLVGIAAVVGVLLPRGGRRDAPYVSSVAAVMTMLAGYLAAILRHPVEARLPDLAAVMVLAWACASGDPIGALFRRGGRQRAAALAGLVAVAGTGFALYHSAGVLSDFEDAYYLGGFRRGLRGAVTPVREAYRRGSEWPWRAAWPTREMPGAVTYINACTDPGDALVVTWRAPEYNFFARRRFSAGHVEFHAPRAFTSDLDQSQMIAWLERDRIPIVLINDTLREEFADAYPRVDGWIRTHYAAVDTFQIYDGSTITIAADRRLTARSVWGEKNWPCHFAGAGR